MVVTRNQKPETRNQQVPVETRILRKLPKSPWIPPAQTGLQKVQNQRGRGQEEIYDNECCNYFWAWDTGISQLVLKNNLWNNIRNRFGGDHGEARIYTLLVSRRSRRSSVFTIWCYLLSPKKKKKKWIFEALEAESWKLLVVGHLCIPVKLYHLCCT